MLTNAGMPRSSALADGSLRSRRRWTLFSRGCWPGPFAGRRSVPGGERTQGHRKRRLHFTRHAREKMPLTLITHHPIGFQRRQTLAASFGRSPPITSGGLANISGIRLERVLSERISHLESPPMNGDLSENTTRLIRVSRIMKAHMGHGSTFE